MNVRVIKQIFRLQPRMFIFLGVLLLSCFSLYLYSSLYQLPRLQTLQLTWFDKRKAMSGGAGLDISAEYAKGLEDLKAWRARIPAKKDFAAFISRLFNMARKNSLPINGISYKSTEFDKKEGLAAYVMNFTVSGKYAAVKSFISDLQSIREMITIDSVSLNNNKISDDIVGLNVQLTVYLRVGEQ